MRHHSAAFLLSLTAAILLSSFLAPSALACVDTTIPSSFNPNDGQQDFKLLGQIAQDARGDYWCSIGAHYRLSEFLSTAPDSFFQQFLSGEYVMLVMVAGLELGARGNMTPDLDAQINHVGQIYTFMKDTSDLCGWTLYDYNTHTTTPHWQAGNTCMDDYAIAASGYAWKAAYMRLSGRDWYPSRWNAVDMIHQSFNLNDAICIYNSGRGFDSLKGPCNAQPSELNGTSVNIISLNHGNQTPAYGLGLMANIAAAFIGLDVTQASVAYSELSSDERTIAKYIYKEAQDKSSAGDFIAGACYDADPWSFGLGCWDAQYSHHYRASLYPLERFYQAYGFDPGVAGGYRFDITQFYFPFDDFFHEGRYETYRTLAYDFIDSRPGLSAGSEFHMAFQAPSQTGNYMNTGGGPGSIVTATSTSPTAGDSQFVIVDLNGGLLIDGDPVAIRVYNNPSYYLSATNGGGSSVTAGSTNIDTYETFHIHKTAGLWIGGPIANGDNIALSSATGYYLHIDNGTITANATGITAFETFNYIKVD